MTESFKIKSVIKLINWLHAHVWCKIKHLFCLSNRLQICIQLLQNIVRLDHKNILNDLAILECKILNMLHLLKLNMYFDK